MISVSRIGSGSVRDGKIKDIKGPFNSPRDNWFQFLELFSPFERKKFWHDASLRNLGVVMG